MRRTVILLPQPFPAAAVSAATVSAAAVSAATVSAAADPAATVSAAAAFSAVQLCLGGGGVQPLAVGPRCCFQLPPHVPCEAHAPRVQPHLPHPLCRKVCLLPRLQGSIKQTVVVSEMIAPYACPARRSGSSESKPQQATAFCYPRWSAS